MSGLRGLLLLATAGLVACSSGPAPDDAAVEADGGATAVGRACEPVSVPLGGFTSLEVYLETSSTQCAAGDAPSGFCITYQLDGDPRAGCSGSGCTPADETALRVFCTCRCSGSGSATDLCVCPSDMTCVDDLITTGGAGVIGGYCVRTAALGG